MPPSKKVQKTCSKGHKFYKSSDCPTCPICEAAKKPKSGFLSLIAAPARRALEKENISTLKKLSSFRESEIKNLHGMGPKALSTLRSVLQENKLTYKKEVAEATDKNKQTLKTSSIEKDIPNKPSTLPGETLTVKSYLSKLPSDRKQVIEKLRKTILDNLPKGFSEGIGYGMIGYSVPHSIYPAGYHCDPKLPLPFVGLASQKHFVALYHMGIYADDGLLKWFTGEYAKVNKSKLDMGKSCLRFKNFDTIPYQLIGELMTKISPQMWIKLYESKLKSR